MLRKFSRTVTSPITITPEFFKGLRRVISELRKLAPEAIRAHTGITDVEFQRAASTEQVDYGEDRGPEIREARRLLEAFETGSFSLGFSSGATIETNDIEQVELALSTEGAIPTEFSFTFGHHRMLHFRISIGQFLFRVMTYNLEGNEIHVNHLINMIDGIIKNSETKYAFLFNKWHYIIFGVMIFAIFMTTYVFFVRLTDRNTLPRTVLAEIFPAYIAVMGFLTFFVTDKYAKLFPQLMFRYGRQSERDAEKKSVILWILGTILIPIILGVLTPIMFPA